MFLFNLFITLFVSKILAIRISYIQLLNDSRPCAHCPKFLHHSINRFTDSDLRLTRPSERCLMNSNLLSLNHFLSRSFFSLTIFFTCTFRVAAAAVDYAINIGARSTLFKTNLRRGCWKSVPRAHSRILRKTAERSSDAIDGWRKTELAASLGVHFFALLCAKLLTKLSELLGEEVDGLKRELELLRQKKVLDGSTMFLFVMHS